MTASMWTVEYHTSSVISIGRLLLVAYLQQAAVVLCCFLPKVSVLVRNREVIQ